MDRKILVDTQILIPTLKSMCFGILDKQTERWMDRHMDGDIYMGGGLHNLLVPPGAPALRWLEELGFSSPSKHRRCMVMQEFGW